MGGMKKKKITLSLLDEIEKSSNFKELELYLDPKLWKGIQETERQKLALLFVKQGDSLGPKSNDEALRSLNLASQIAPLDSFVLSKKFLSLLRLPSSKERDDQLLATYKEQLMLSSDDLKRADLVNQSEELLSTILQIANSQNAPVWQIGLFQLVLGEQSGEPQDFHVAASLLERAIEEGFNTHFELAIAYAKLGELLSQKEFFEKSFLQFEKEEVSSMVDELSYLFEYAKACQQGYSLTREDKLLEKGHTLFSRGVKCCYEMAPFWLSFGLLLKEAGNVKRSVALLEESFDKFDKSAKLTSDVEAVLIHWAEALLLAGVLCENVDYLREAHEKLSYALMFITDDPKLYLLIGNTLNELSNYFQDPTYLFEAIDKFQNGVSLNQSDWHLWWGLAASYLSLGEMHQDFGCLEKAHRFFQTAEDVASELMPHFWNEWGYTLLKLGEYQLDRRLVEGAIERFDRAIRQHLQEKEASSIDPQVVFNLGSALDFLGDLTLDPLYYEQSIQILTKVLILDPDYPQGKFHLALAHTHLGEITSDVESFKNALELFESIIAEDPEDDFVWNDWAVALIHFAELVREPAKPEEGMAFMALAEERLLRALSLGNLHALYNLACLHSIKGEFEASLHYLQKALQAQALPPLQDLLEDEWLEAVRKSDGFTQFIEQLGH